MTSESASNERLTSRDPGKNPPTLSGGAKIITFTTTSNRRSGL